MKISIPIRPFDALYYGELSKLEKCDSSPFSSEGDCINLFGENARSLLSKVLSKLKLTKHDVVSILTSSDAEYVSTCLTITAFNHASVSRVVNEKTKVVIVVHEHGYLYPDIVSLVEKLRVCGVFVIEDCAHLLGRVDNGYYAGSLGDVALFSLPKVLPMESGGLLRGTRYQLRQLSLVNDGLKNSDIERAFYELQPYWLSINQRRKDNYKVIKENFGKHLAKDSSNSIPWFVYLESQALSEVCLGGVELGATLLDNLSLIPTNPLVPASVFAALK